MRTVILGIALLVIFAFVSQEAKIALEISLAIVFTLVLFISLLIDLGTFYKSEEEEEEFEMPLEGEIAEEEVEEGVPEEAEAIVVEAEPTEDSSDRG